MLLLPLWVKSVKKEGRVTGLLFHLQYFAI